MARITIEADSHEQLVEFVKRWVHSASPEGEAEKFAKAISRMYGPITRGFVEAVAEAAERGQQMFPDAEFAKRFGKDHAGQLGGAIAAAWAAFTKFVGRDVLQSAKYPTRYWMSKEDAVRILAALRERDRA